MNKDYLKIIRKSKLFDGEWYLRTYPDVAAQRIDPALHYLQAGAREGRNPSAAFGTRDYLLLNPDVASAHVNPLVHYERFGRREGRLYSLGQMTTPTFPESAVNERRNYQVAPRKHGRTAVFAAYFGDGHIPEADIYYLRGLREVVDNIVFVADCPVLPGELDRLEGLVTLAVCERHGEYDFGSYKRGYFYAEEMGLLNPEVVDELVIANDSCLGPLYSFCETFDRMRQVACDFWGMTQHAISGKPHIQSFFYVFRHAPLSSGAVREFFQQYKGSSNRINVVLNGELRLTEFLVERGGYTFNSLVPLGMFQDLPMKYPVTLVRKHRLPLIKVKTLRGDSRQPLTALKAFLERENPTIARFASTIPVDEDKVIRDPLTVRKVVKMLVPYGVERYYQRRHYKMDEVAPCESEAGSLGWLKRTFADILPYGLVMRSAQRAGGAFHERRPSLWRRLASGRAEQPFVSVVVASYNYEKLVLETLESLWAQTYRNFEIIVVDDGSKDASRKNIRAFIKAHEAGDVTIRLLTHPGEANQGLAATVERGVQEAKGEYVAFCESDDLWTPDHLAVVAENVCRYARPAVVVNDVAIFGDSMGVARAERNRALRYKLLCHTWNRISPQRFRQMNYLLTFSCVMVKRSILQGCNYHPDPHPPALDWWLWRQVCFAHDIFFINKKLTQWRMHDSYLEKTRVVKANEKPIVEREKALMAACDVVIRSQHPLSFSAHFLMRAPTERRKSAYVMKGARRRQFFRHRAEGLALYRSAIERNRKARLLVCLHLFYEDSWPLISEYLENLAPYSYDLFVTCVEGTISAKALDSVKARVKNVRVLELPNNGFDIGPFVESLNHIHLEDYDIVFKLQSKGVGRKFIYIYNQIFKWSDWFFNLYDGVLDGLAVHELIDSLMNGGAKLAAAKNLVVADPKHKQAFVQRTCEERQLPYVDGYRFVAGTCFAIKASALEPLKALGLTIADFEGTERGVFSLAHFLERWMCFSAAGAIREIAVSHNVYPAEVKARKATSALRLLDDSRFKLDYEFFYRVMELRPVRTYDVVEVRLGDIHRRWYDGRIMTLDECEPFKYLNGDKKAYDDYCAQNKALSGFDMGEKRFEELVKDMEEYDPLSMPVVMGPKNIIFDGQHRSCILLKKYGPDHVIKVLRFE